MDLNKNFIEILEEKYQSRWRDQEWYSQIIVRKFIDKEFKSEIKDKINLFYNLICDLNNPVILDYDRYLLFVMDNDSTNYEDYFGCSIIDEDFFATLLFINPITRQTDKDNDFFQKFFFEELAHVSVDNLHEEEQLLVIHFKDNREPEYLSSTCFGCTNSNTSEIIRDILNEMIKLSQDEEPEKKLNKFVSTTVNLLNEEKGDQALKLILHFGEVSDLNDDTNLSTYYILLMRCYLSLKEWDKLLQTVQLILKIKDLLTDSEMCMVYMHQSLAYAHNNQNHKALFSNNKAFELNSEREFDEILIEHRDGMYNNLKDDFSTIPMRNRKFVMVSNIEKQIETICVLKLGDLPEDINFPVGHPQNNKVYTCHPLKNNLYLPLDSYQKQLFIDRLDEFQILMQSLGATQCEISSANEKIVVEDSKRCSNTAVEASYKMIKGKVNIENERLKASRDSSHIKLGKIQIYEPHNVPEIPEGLIWFKDNLSWQRLAEQRLKGNILKHQMTLSTSQIECVSQDELRKVDAELKMFFANAEVNHSSNYSSNSKSTFNYDCKISVEFESVNTLREKFGHLKVEGVVDENENFIKYADEVKFMLEDDGIIDDMERKMLDRKAQSFGLTQEEQKEIENKILYQEYDDNEINYIKEIEDFKKDGKITEMELKMLDRYANRYKLTETQKTSLNQKYI